VREQMEHRLVELRQEFEKGRTLLEETEQKKAELQQRMLRIDGAIHVLKELLDGEDDRPVGLLPQGPMKT